MNKQQSEVEQETTTAKKKRKKNKKKKKQEQESPVRAFDNMQLDARSYKASTGGYMSHRISKQESANSADKKANRNYDLQYTPLKFKLGDSFYDDTDSSEDEGMPDYKVGGYHCMHVGEVLVERYVII